MADDASDTPRSQPDRQRALRTALGQFATGVCIVSCADDTAHPTPFAITVNSFASVSLEPALVLWCIQKQSTTYELWMRAKQFGISVLNEQQSDLCNRFALRGNHAMGAAGDYEFSTAGNPLIVGAVATFDCDTDAHHDAGDHTIIVARVRNFTSDESQQPLIYARGAVYEST
ncbi:MAG: flavin reductase family protein [Pseudomonadota bacterium]